DRHLSAPLRRTTSARPGGGPAPWREAPALTAQGQLSSPPLAQTTASDRAPTEPSGQTGTVTRREPQPRLNTWCDSSVKATVKSLVAFRVESRATAMSRVGPSSRL